MPFPYDTDDQDAIDRLAAVSNATFANGAHVTNFPPRLNDTATLANAVADAAAAADASADQTALDVIAAAASAAKLSGTSTTLLAIGTGSKVFTTQASKFFDEQDLKAYSAADPDKWMLGLGEYSGTTLTMEVTHTNGVGTVNDWVIVVTGRVGSAGTIEIGAVDALAPGASPTVENVGSNDAAELEFGIPVGAPAGLAFNWSTNTDADTDPTAGKVKAGSASLEAAVFLYVSETDADGRAVAADIGTWDDSDSDIRGKLFIKDPVTPANFVEYNITGAIIDSGAWRKIPVEHVAHGGTLTNALRLYIQNSVYGEKGDPGTAGTAATVTVGTVTTGAAGSAADVDNSGTSGAAILDFIIPRGATGLTGPVVAMRMTFSTSITDSDPGAGVFRFNNPTLSSVTAAYIDNADAAAGADISAWLDTFDDTTNTTSKGYLFFVNVDDAAIWAIYKVTSTVVDGTGYRKLTLTHIASTGTFASGATFGLAFFRTGDKGADGLGAGDFIGPASAGDGNLVRFDGTDGKLGKDGGAISANALTFVAASNFANMRTALGVAIGSDVQAYNAILAALGGLANVSGLLEQTGASTFTQRVLGVGASTSVPTRADADARYLMLAGGTMSGNIVLAGDPGSALHPATKQYVDGLSTNMGKRARVRAATIANITIATALNNGDTLDGVSLATDDLVLVKNQTAPEENGVYKVAASPARDAQFDTYNEHPGSLIAVEEGSTNADTLWLCTSNDGGTLNTTAIAFNKLVTQGELLAANNLSDVSSGATAFTNIKQAASDTATGVVELATTAEAAAGSDTTRAVTPEGVKVAVLQTEDLVLTGGARVTSKSLGTQTTGTLTLDPGDRPLQHLTNGGAFTLAPGANTGSFYLDITNNGSAGAITTSGFTKVSGDSFTTTNGNKFRCGVSIGDGGSLLQVQALQ